jgi:hypothetical protein
MKDVVVTTWLEEVLEKVLEKVAVNMFRGLQTYQSIHQHHTDKGRLYG